MQYNVNVYGIYKAERHKAQFEIIHYGEGQIHMKCPICGQELRPGKKDPNYLLCYNCKKKFKIPQSAHKVQKRAEKPEHVFANFLN